MLSSVGSPASQGQRLDFWKVEEVRQASHSPWANEQRAHKNQ